MNDCIAAFRRKSGGVIRVDETCTGYRIWEQQERKVPKRTLYGWQTPVSEFFDVLVATHGDQSAALADAIRRAAC